MQSTRGIIQLYINKKDPTLSCEVFPYHETLYPAGKPPGKIIPI